MTAEDIVAFDSMERFRLRGGPVAWYRICRHDLGWEVQVNSTDGRFVCRYGDTLAEAAYEALADVKVMPGKGDGR